jgi:hypothetical protein
MIDEVLKIHDKFTLEIKTAFVGRNPNGENQFNFKSWFFVPSSLDINSHTYSKDVFYRDLKVNTRLITPVFTLEEIVSGENSPLLSLEKAIVNLDVNSPQSFNEYEYQLKMFNSILKSALRQTILKITSQAKHEFADILLESSIEYCKIISTRYRALEPQLIQKKVNDFTLEIFLFGDEFMSFLIESHCFKLVKRLEIQNNKHTRIYITQLLVLVEAEIAYKKGRGYQIVEKESADNNRRTVFKRGVLKKYFESELFLTVQKKEDAFVVKQFIYSIAAGISMIFATVIAFSFQQKYGNFTMPFFTAVVVGYMLKDRIKELGRYYFAHKFSSRYYDLKTRLKINNHFLGWCKDGFDFIDEQNIPSYILEKRSRSSLLEADNKYNKEEVMLYRACVKTDNSIIQKYNKYEVEGLNRIIRFNLKSLTGKMDNPVLPLFMMNENAEMDIANGEKVYYLNIILELGDDDTKELHRYLVCFNRDGIIEVKNL